MNDIFTPDGSSVIPSEARQTPRQKSEQAYRDLNSRTHAASAIQRAGRNASADDLKAIAFAILEEAKVREAK